MYSTRIAAGHWKITRNGGRDYEGDFELRNRTDIPEIYDEQLYIME